MHDAVTKAGVPTRKIFVGESSYGRSFKMADPKCGGPKCTFLGDRLNSPAKEGRCTKTAGYIANAEIYEIIDSQEVALPDGPKIRVTHDRASNSDILIYDGKSLSRTHRGVW